MYSELGWTNNVDLVVGDEAYAGSAAGHLILVSGVCVCRTSQSFGPHQNQETNLGVEGGKGRTAAASTLNGECNIPLSIARSVARKPSFRACS